MFRRVAPDPGRTSLCRARGFLALAVVVTVSSALLADAVPLFDGRTFDGWEGPLESFRIEDGSIVGGTLDARIPMNQFLATKKSFSDFELRLEFKLVGANANAGVQIRSRRIPDHHEMIGYQADLGGRYWGSLYDESRRRRIIAQANLEELMEMLRPGDWNEYRIRCEGHRVRLWINGYQTVDYTEADDSIEQNGVIAVQIHSGPPSEAWYRNITIDELTVAEPALRPGVRGVATRAPGKVTVDGDLSEFGQAFGTPLGYFDSKLRDRAGQFLYMWDDEAFYAALRTLDTTPANHAPDDRLWEGDGVEWYFDTRRGADFRSRQWGAGAVHCYWVGLTGTDIRARFCLRPGYLDAIPKTGVEVASRRTTAGMDVEFKLPWVNFPDFQPTRNEVIAVDSELCYSDGGPRVDRNFVYGGPLSVQQPANLARIQLVDEFRREYWQACAPVLAPVRCDTAWSQETRPQVTAYMALPPNQGRDIARVLFRLANGYGSTIGEYDGTVETFETYGNFRRAVAQWSSDLSPPGTYALIGILYDRQGRELTRVAPRMVSVGMRSGY